MGVSVCARQSRKRLAIERGARRGERRDTGMSSWMQNLNGGRRSPYSSWERKYLCQFHAPILNMILNGGLGASSPLYSYSLSIRCLYWSYACQINIPSVYLGLYCDRDTLLTLLLNLLTSLPCTCTRCLFAWRRCPNLQCRHHSSFPHSTANIVLLLWGQQTMLYYLHSLTFGLLWMENRRQQTRFCPIKIPL